MADHITEWLGAYHDGELQGARLRQVEQHLTECTDCQAALEELRGLSALLQETPVGEGFLPAERFVANLNLNLPRRPQQPPARRWQMIAWWAIPVSLLAAWLFVNTTLWLGALAGWAVNAGLISRDAAWLQGSMPQMDWYAPAMNLAGSWAGAPGQATLMLLHDVQLVLGQLLASLIPQALLAAGYVAWLFAWWLRSHPGQVGRNSESIPQS